MLQPFIMPADFKRHLIFVLFPSFFTAANCSPAKCFIISFVSFTSLLHFSLFHYYSQIPSALDEAGLYNSTIVEMKTNDAHYVFPYAVFLKTSKRLHLQAIRYFIHENHFLSSCNHLYRLNVK